MLNLYVYTYEISAIEEMETIYVNFAVVEDLKTDSDRLVELITENCEENGDSASFYVYDKAEKFLEDYKSGFCNAIFLDIILGGTTGIEAARKIRELDNQVPIVFTTSELDFSLESYGVHALDYLVKPVNKSSVEWCMSQIRQTAALPLFVEVREINGGNIGIERAVLIHDITYMEAMRNGVVIHTTDEDIQIRRSLAVFVKSLPRTDMFFECGRGLVVNLERIEDITRDGEVMLDNGVSLFCSRRKLKEARDAFAKHRIDTLREGGAL